jgi:hypothetical protein
VYKKTMKEEEKERNKEGKNRGIKKERRNKQPTK